MLQALYTDNINVSKHLQMNHKFSRETPGVCKLDHDHSLLVLFYPAVSRICILLYLNPHHRLVFLLLPILKCTVKTLCFLNGTRLLPLSVYICILEIIHVKCNSNSQPGTMLTPSAFARILHVPEHGSSDNHRMFEFWNIFVQPLCLHFWHTCLLSDSKQAQRSWLDSTPAIAFIQTILK